MKKISILLSIAVLLPMLAMAQVLSPTDALSKALKNPTVKQLQAVSVHGLPSADCLVMPDYQLAKTYEANGEPAVYLYLPTNCEGFLMTTAEGSPAAQTVLGYSDAGRYNADCLPAPLEYQARTFAQSIKELRDDLRLVIDETPMRAPRKAIAPLVKTQWGQDSPFNLFCPTGEKTGSPVNNHYFVGCVATAMAQIMKAHDWPKAGRGHHEYDNPVGDGRLSYDYEGHAFDWEHMNERYIRYALYYGAERTANDDAVADLSYATSVSVNMGFSNKGSGTKTEYVAPALVNNFRYDKSIHLADRKYFTLQAWEDLIYNQLAQGQPVFYSCTVHAYVCDGYQGDGLFHMNFGWYGQSDGYYALSAVIPGSTGEIVQKPNSSWLTDHVIVYNIRPEGEDNGYTEMVTADNFAFVKSGADTYSVRGPFRAYALEMAGAISGQLGISLERVNSDGSYEQPVYVEGSQFANATYRAKIADSFNVVLEDVADGTYRVRPAHRDSHGNWQPVRIVATGTQYAMLIIVNGVGDVAPAATRYPTAAIYRWPKAIYNYTGNKDAVCEVQIQITSTDDEDESTGQCKIAVVDANNNHVAFSDGFDRYSVQPGKSVKMKLNHGYTTYSNAQGDYLLRVVVCDAMGDVKAWISDPVPVWFGRQGAEGDPGEGYNDAAVPEDPNGGEGGGNGNEGGGGEQGGETGGDVVYDKGDIVTFDANNILDAYFIRSAYATDKYMTYDGGKVKAMDYVDEATNQVWSIVPDEANKGKYFIEQDGKKVCFERMLVTEYIYMSADPAAEYYDLYSFYINDVGIDADGNHRYVFDAGAQTFPGYTTSALACTKATGGDLRPRQASLSATEPYWYLLSAVEPGGNQGGDENGIPTIIPSDDAAWYDLCGRPVSAPSHGCFINRKGTKVVVK